MIYSNNDMLQVALRRSRGKNCLSSMTINLEIVRVSKLRKSHYYIQATIRTCVFDVKAKFIVEIRVHT